MTFQDVLKARKTDKATLTDVSLRLAETPCFALLSPWNPAVGTDANLVSVEWLRFRLKRAGLRYTELVAVLSDPSRPKPGLLTAIPFVMVEDMPYDMFKRTLIVNDQSMGVYRSLSKIQYRLGSMVETLAEGQVFCYYSGSGALKVLGDLRPNRIAQEFAKVFSPKPGVEAQVYVTFNYPAQTWRQRISQFIDKWRRQ